MQNPSSRWEVLSITRFILAMIVLLGHVDLSLHMATWWTSIGLYLNQRSAVFGFLLISGYSIAASLDRDEKGFFWRRFRRIYPVYIASLGLAFASELTSRSLEQPPSTYLVTILMLQTFADHVVYTDGQLWSVAIEWWNYMLAPIFKRLRDVGVWLLIALSLFLFLLLGTPDEPASTTGGLMFAQLTWMWLVGFLYYRRRRTLYGYALLVVPLALAANFGWIGRAAWIGAAALAVCDDLKVPERLRAFSRWLGDLSYPIYAVHVPLFAFCLYWQVKSPMLVVLSVLAASAVVLHAIDLPIRKAGRSHPQLKPLRGYAT